MQKLKAGKMVWVKWVDSHEDGGWKYKKDAIRWANKGKVSCWSCGFLVMETQKSIVLGLSKSAVGSWNSLIKIPKLAIKKTRMVRRLRKDR